MHRYAPGRTDEQGQAVDDTEEIGGRVLIVDDEKVTRAFHRAILARHFDVLTASSGSEALELCVGQTPDLIVLDVEMPGIDGYETCRRLRAFTSVPILFVTGHQSLEEHLKAFDAGGTDLITKPVNADIFQRKVAVAIRQYRAAAALAEEKKALERMAMGFLSSVSQTGILLDFMRKSIASHDYRALADSLLAAIQELGLTSCVLVRHPDGEATAVTDHGEPTALEQSILDHVSEMGRLFQFKRRLVVNYDRVSIIVSDMPDETEETERAGILRDSLVILAESAEALSVNVDIRQEGQKRAEQLQIALSEAEVALTGLGEQNKAAMRDTRLLLQEMVDSIEKTYGWLNTSQTQEATINATMEQAIQRILERLASGGDFDTQFAQVLQALNAGRSHNAVELF
ncbi:PleD family two-component system response regulator [Zoogloea sp. LCSB751]|uniref:response regulator n=1 Tax=Zoogloea sp. LCSB751 TaxID=1965277 RepID=UPI0009A483DC|nr:response regulator [Zoogloea sp. LCSB751]